MKMKLDLKKIASLIAGLFLITSLLFPFVGIILTSPQYRSDPPRILLYLYKLEGDMNEWKVLGRYVGINVEPQLPEFKSKVLVYIIGFAGIMAIISAFLDKRWKKIVSILIIIVGIGCAGLAQYRLYQQGHSLDPNAPLRNVAKPFTPPLFGITRIHRITIYHFPHVGTVLIGVATVITFLSAWTVERKKDKPNKPDAPFRGKDNPRS